jgi:hypothetical protein
LPDYQDTGEWRCVKPPIGRDTDVAEKRQKDRNPFSPTFGEDRWVSIGNRPDLCPIDTDPCNLEVWVDMQDADCNLITRCKFDPPRRESTRQKQQFQANDRLPNYMTTRWVDMPPSPDDAIQCPVETCPIYVPVCPEQTRCKYSEPRYLATVEQLKVDVNPNSPTFGMQVWVEIGEDLDACPIQPQASQFSISGARLLANQLPQSFIPNCTQIWYIPGNNNLGLFNFVSGPNEIVARWDLARTIYTDPRDMVNPPTSLPAWIQVGYTNGLQSLSTFVRFDDVVRWAKVYHVWQFQPQINGLTGTISIPMWIGNDISGVTTQLLTYNDNDELIEIINAPTFVNNINNNAPYNIYWAEDFIGGCPESGELHKNRTVDPPETLPDGTILRESYTRPYFSLSGIIKYVHVILINGEQYASMQGYIRNII